MSWEIVIGIETHAQLLTRSKIFSGAPTAFGAPPNAQASAVDIALPGVLPVLNRAAVEHAIRFGLAVKGTINRRSIFERKNYFYPDLPKGYQISQYEVPIVQGGYIEIPRKIRITRAHLEEDAGKSLHEMFHGMTGIDLNRAGTPLLEIVSEPDLRGAQEAAAYARALHRLVTWIGICDGNMQEGSFRCDANVSVRRPGERLGTRCEIKNLNSFRFMEHAIEFEAQRQIEILEAGGTVEQETRLYDPERDETRSLRTKEEAHDYRYFPDPDLLPLVVEQSMVEELRRTLPELPDVKRARYAEMGVAAQAAELLVASRESAECYDRALAAGGTSEAIANLMTGELAALLNDAQTGFSASPVSPEDLALVQRRVADGTISGKISKQLLKARFDGETASIDALIEKRGLRQISDAAALEQLVDEVLAKNEKQVADYRAGRDKAFNALVGQVMKATRGKANPVQAGELLRKKLKI
ncbi:MAG TPA: Asp-tRNA(Asn)/Glu-tRNA(Gln) amidotransferase subunit GatB [Burkholderiales bacterium]|nr:Asp-tRNA(Asn)/Glu-tRNA(Gln) amidotransferase subunit GatB [Burkholderiales bacterium]